MVLPSAPTRCNLYNHNELKSSDSKESPEDLAALLDLEAQCPSSLPA